MKQVLSPILHLTRYATEYHSNVTIEHPRKLLIGDRVFYDEQCLRGRIAGFQISAYWKTFGLSMERHMEINT